MRNGPEMATPSFGPRGQGPAQGEGRKRRVMVVEDEAITALHLEMLLGDLGYQVCSVEATGEGAILAAARYHPDLVLMDIRLAGEVDGLTAAGQIRRIYGIPSLMLTAFNDPDTEARAEDCGTLGLLCKPYTARQVEHRVREALEAISGLRASGGDTTN